MSTDREALIDKLRVATEGSRELDVHVKVSKDGGTCFRWTQSVGEMFYEAFRADGEQLWLLGEDQIPHYTTSIDAALTLVPEGWFTDVALEDHSGRGWSWGLTSQQGAVATANWHPTPALALCIAALEARDHG